METWNLSSAVLKDEHSGNLYALHIANEGKMETVASHSEHKHCFSCKKDENIKKVELNR